MVFLLNHNHYQINHDVIYIYNHTHAHLHIYIYMENGGSAVKMYTNTPQALRLIFFL